MMKSRFIDPAVAVLKERDSMPDEKRLTAEISTAIGCTKRHSIDLMRKLKDGGLAHIGSYVERYGREAAPAWRFGPGEDAPHPGNRPEKSPRNWRESPQLVRAAAWLKAGNTGTAKQIGAAVHASDCSISRGMALMLESKEVVVVEVVKNGSRAFAWATDENRHTKPKQPTPVKLSVYRRNKHMQLVKEHGEEIAQKIKRSMWGKDRSPVKIVIDGKLVYQRRSRARKQLQGEANHV